MSFLATLYWIILILCIIGLFVPNYPRVNSAAERLLFILIGIRLFPVDLS